MTTTRVLLVTPDFPPMGGGIQLLLSQLVQHAAWDTTVVCFQDGARPGAGPGDVVRVRRTSDHRLSILRLGAATIRETRRRAPDLIVCGHLVLGPAALAAAPRRPALQFVYGMELGSRRTLVRPVCSRMGATIAISDYTRDVAVAAGAPPARVHIVLPGGGGATDPAPAPATRAPHVVTVARLEDRYKGFDVLMRAIPLVRARVPDARWIVIGDGGLRGELESTARRWGLGDAVIFLGWVSDATRDEVLARAAVFAMPSRVPAGTAEGEGFGLVYLEAAAAGLPVVAGDEGGATSAVVDGVTGLLCDPRDHVAVAERIVRLLHDPDLAHRLGTAGRERQRDFTWTRMAREVDAVADSLLDR